MYGSNTVRKTVGRELVLVIGGMNMKVTSGFKVAAFLMLVYYALIDHGYPVLRAVTNNVNLLLLGVTIPWMAIIFALGVFFSKRWAVWGIMICSCWPIPIWILYQKLPEHPQSFFTVFVMLSCVLIFFSIKCLIQNKETK